jgi:membrane associated rhomboid family serine protease
LIPYKDDNPTRTTPFVTLIIIALNVGVFVLQLLSARESQRIAYDYGAIPQYILHFHSDQPIPAPLTIFTSMFMHGGLMHIGGNGHVRFIFFYLFCGVVAAFAHALSSPGSAIPMIGASGAISGVLGAYLLLFPSARVHTIVFFGFFIQVIRIPALIVIGFWAIIQFVSGLITQGILHQGGTAWFAHVGGFLAGLVTIKLWLPRRNYKW